MEMSKHWSKIVFGISNLSLIGLYCLTVVPSALAASGNTTTTSTSGTSSNNTSISSLFKSLISFTGSDDTGRAASAEFGRDGNQLLVKLTNTSTKDIWDPQQVLTAVFFNLPGNVKLTPLSALLPTGSQVFYDSDGQPTNGNVGGEWVYKNSLNLYGANQGIGASGLGGTFGAKDTNFGGPNLAGANNVGGLDYGILSAGDNTSTGNGGVTGSGGLIKNSVLFTLSGISSDFDFSQISNVFFQYGTSLSEGGFTGKSTSSSSSNTSSSTGTTTTTGSTSGSTGTTTTTGSTSGSTGTTTTTGSTSGSTGTTTTSTSGNTSSTTSVPTSLVFNLDCVISGTVGNNSYSGGSNCANAGKSFGTLTLKENATDSKKVDVFVDLAGNNVHKLLDINLNFNDSLFPVSGQSWNVAAGSGYDVKSFTSNENNIKPGGYQGMLDFQISPKATGPSNDGYTATISLGSFDLDIKNFDFKDTLNNIFAGVHIGNYGNNPGVSGGNSIWVGASTYYKPSASPTPKKVPEPSSTLAFGLFILGSLRLSKKHKKHLSQG